MIHSQSISYIANIRKSFNSVYHYFSSILHDNISTLSISAVGKKVVGIGPNKNSYQHYRWRKQLWQNLFQLRSTFAHLTNLGYFFPVTTLTWRRREKWCEHFQVSIFLSFKLTLQKKELKLIPKSREKIWCNETEMF